MFSNAPAPVLPAQGRLELPPAPDRPACQALWNQYDLPEHIRQHSLAVAEVAVATCQLAEAAGLKVSREQALAAALLHDLAKMHAINHGGRHGPLAAAWIMRATGHPLVAQAVFHHVFWPWKLDLDMYALPLIIIYSDKRVTHCRMVRLSERYADIMDRYGRKSERSREYIKTCNRQWTQIETLLSERLGVNLDAYPFDSRRLVE